MNEVNSNAEMSSGDWRDKAVLSKNSDQMRLRLKKAEELAKHSSDWCECAKIWNDLADDKQEAIRCMQKAEALAKDDAECRICAKQWKCILGDEGAERRCQHKAEELAKNSGK